MSMSVWICCSIPAHLDHNGLAAGQPSPVNLGDGGGGQRGPGKFRKKLRDGMAQFPNDLRLDGLGGHRRNLVLQLAQFGDILPGQDVGPGRQQLAELDKGRPEFLQGEPQTLGTRQPADFLAGDARPAFLQNVVDVELLNDVAEAVLDQYTENLSIAAQGADIAGHP
jgi:hypothetical protein